MADCLAAAWHVKDSSLRRDLEEGSGTPNARSRTRLGTALTKLRGRYMLRESPPC